MGRSSAVCKEQKQNKKNLCVYILWNTSRIMFANIVKRVREFGENSKIMIKV